MRSPQTAVDGTLTVSEVGDAAVTIPSTVPPLERKCTASVPESGEKPRPLRTTESPTFTLKGETCASTNGVSVSETISGIGVLPIEISVRKISTNPLTASAGTGNATNVG